MGKLECLGGCGDRPLIFFFLNVHRLSDGVGTKTKTFGVCDVCSTPGSARYQAFRQAFGSLLFMAKNDLFGEPVDSKTAAAGGK